MSWPGLSVAILVGLALMVADVPFTFSNVVSVAALYIAVSVALECCK